MLRNSPGTIVWAVFTFAIAPSSNALHAEDVLPISAGQLCIVLGDRAGTAEQRAVDLFTAEVKRRTGLDIPIAPKASTKYALVVGTTASSALIQGRVEQDASSKKLGPDGFRLVMTPNDRGQLFVVGQSPSGVVAGMGKLLRITRYAEGLIRVPAQTMSENPHKPIRGIYFATHFENFYHAAPLEEVDQIIEECALWGTNYLQVWFDMHHFQSFEDPSARKFLARLKHFATTAHRIGMKFGLVFIANEGYAGSPEHLRAKWRPRWWHFHRELCPSNPEGLALIGKWQAQVLDAFDNVDFVWAWPYDQGGCACDQCMPWGCNGFLRAAEQLSQIYRERFPKGEVFLSTWLFDSLDETGMANRDGLISNVEYSGVFRYIRQSKPDWFDGFIMGTHGTWFPKPLLDRPSPDKYVLTNFPEISMYRMGPWGGSGANPLPRWCKTIADMVGDHIVGGWPYSEGIYEDINKCLWAQFYWDPAQITERILTEYADYYLGPDSAPDAVRLFDLLEKTHARKNWEVENLAEADEAWRLAQGIDTKLAPWAKNAWRWRIIYIRAAMDYVLKHQGHKTLEAQKALKPYCDELVRIYHAYKTTIRPPALNLITDK